MLTQARLMLKCTGALPVSTTPPFCFVLSLFLLFYYNKLYFYVPSFNAYIKADDKRGYTPKYSLVLPVWLLSMCVCEAPQKMHYETSTQSSPPS